MATEGNRLGGTDFDTKMLTASEIIALLEGKQDLIQPYMQDPLMDGTASYGNISTYAAGNHRHPTDTSRQGQLVAQQVGEGKVRTVVAQILNNGSLTSVELATKDFVPDGSQYVLKAGDTMTGPLTIQDSLTVGSRLDGSAIGTNSVAEGSYTAAIGNQSHAEGFGATASGEHSHAEGGATSAGGSQSHAEGLNTTALGSQSHAEGDGTEANGSQSHAEGAETKTIGQQSHAEGYRTKALGPQSHAEGYASEASGDYSHAEGGYTTASGLASHAEGNYTIAQNSYEHAQGLCNASHKASATFGNAGNTLSSIGFGSGINNRKNAVEVMQDGKVFVYGLGGYNGTNPTGSGVKDLVTAIGSGGGGQSDRIVSPNGDTEVVASTDGNAYLRNKTNSALRWDWASGSTTLRLDFDYSAADLAAGISSGIEFKALYGGVEYDCSAPLKYTQGGYSGYGPISGWINNDNETIEIGSSGVVAIFGDTVYSGGTNSTHEAFSREKIVVESGLDPLFLNNLKAVGRVSVGSSDNTADITLTGDGSGVLTSVSVGVLKLPNSLKASSGKSFDGSSASTFYVSDFDGAKRLHSHNVLQPVAPEFGSAGSIVVVGTDGSVRVGRANTEDTNTVACVSIEAGTVFSRSNQWRLEFPYGGAISLEGVGQAEPYTETDVFVRLTGSNVAQFEGVVFVHIVGSVIYLSRTARASSNSTICYFRPSDSRPQSGVDVVANVTSNEQGAQAGLSSGSLHVLWFKVLPEIDPGYDIVFPANSSGTTKTVATEEYVDARIGDIDSVLDAINGEVI